ncbi:hypothetical protein QF046_001130 [Microbacterium sp. W4I4]|uniref:hypothetical protein n=1 Tax=Microbacterium sp. W4I4 TaxID=3042295 RepID=UPI0027855BBF|nr:hypothetical protein [Microbacterium sp. W4I4]MDQ0613489.1 hypothetical protein [Microbacterium sp. W4I4]
MSAEQIAFQVTYTSVESGDGSDPTSAVERILAGERVLAAVREFDGDAVIALIPVTEGGDVVALDAEGRLRFDLSESALVALFADEGLTLHLGYADDGLDDVDAALEEEFGEAFEQLDEPTDEPDDLNGFGMPSDADDLELFEAEPVRVAEFSRRAVWAARLTAQLLDTDVDYLEDGTWSVYRYRTDRVHGAISGGRADGPIIEVNIPQHGDAWVEVTSPHGRSAMFWPNAEQHTRPVLDIDTIGMPESAELYRRMLTEADGTREELASLAMGDAVDVDAAMGACLSETLGGVVGADARLRAFVGAFGVPASLIRAGLDEQDAGRRVVARGWGPTVGGIVLGGLVEMTPLTRRDRPVARLARLLRKRPVLGMSLSTAELAAGVALSRSRSGLGRGIGILLVIDAVADIAIWIVRILRRR